MKQLAICPTPSTFPKTNPALSLGTKQADIMQFVQVSYKMYMGNRFPDMQVEQMTTKTNKESYSGKLL